MASSVFGAPVTKATLSAMPEYQGKNSISQADLAKVALEQVNEKDKGEKARTFLEKLQSRFGDDQASTKGLMYNATGANMTFEFSYDMSGRVCESPYPVVVANGQWAAFLHGQYYGAKDAKSSAVVAYSALNDKGVKMLWLMYFYTSSTGHYNEVRTAIWNNVSSSTYDPPKEGEISPAFKEQLRTIFKSDPKDADSLVCQANENGGYLSGSIGNTKKAVFEAILTLPELK